MTNQDYRNGYRDGWQDAMDSYNKQPDASKTIPGIKPTTWPTITIPQICGVCGQEYKNLTHYVCNHPRCPTKVSCAS